MKILWLELIITVIILIGSFSQSQTITTSVDRSAAIATDILIRHKIPGGLSLISDCRSKSLLVFVPPSEESKQAAEQIAASVGGLARRGEDGNFSICVGCSRQSAVLNVHVPGGDIRFEAYVYAIQQIVDLPGVEGAIAELGMSQGLQQGALLSLADREQKQISIRAGTLKDALNQVAQYHGQAVWREDEEVCKDKAKAYWIQWASH
jgi:hypothetical protein